MRTLLICLLLPLSLKATQFPLIPASTRALTAEEVQNYWFNTLRALPFPKKPSSLYPGKQSAWEENLRVRKERLLAILNGRHHTSAQLAALEHNIEAYRALGDSAKLRAASKERQEILEHRARLALLHTQRRSASRVADAAERVATAAETVDQASCEPPSYPAPCEPTHRPEPRPPSCPTPPPERPVPRPTPRQFPRGA